MRKRKIGRIFYAALLGLALSSLSSHIKADDAERAKHKHQQLHEWLCLFSGEARARLRDAKKETLKNRAVRAARQRRIEVQSEYCALLRKEILATCSVCSRNLSHGGRRIGSKPWLAVFECQRQFL
jgi:hypothetical protein